ncbi:MAG: site-specific DNA-methyltransferase [Xanthomonadaceae bacterium]|nr:site-specific DNA-methyltransferase [Xanthomonadaceae bacterium]
MPSLNWIGKDAVVKHHKDVPFRLLEPVQSLSCAEDADNAADSGNLIVQGDNLLALKALLPRYAGQVKCIYIDPPYNTGNEGWIYNDNVNSPEIKRWLGEVVGKEGETLDRHDRWLCMMYPRLMLLKQFLREDGVMFVSIDDNEVANLRFLCDEIFGTGNRVGAIVWKNATDNNPTQIASEHEYVLCYAKEKSKLPSEWKSTTLAVKAKLLEIGDAFVRDHSDPEERQTAYTQWFRKNKDHLWPFQDYKFIDSDGVYTGMRSVHNPGKEGYRYDVIHPETGKPCQQPLMGYRFPEETMRRLLNDKRILFGDDETKLVELKVYAKDYRAKLSSLFELDGRIGTNEIKNIFPENKRPFDFPKPIELIEELLSFTTSKNDLVLDSFGGSGTTAQAVLSLNQSDGQNRRFILVEMDDGIARNVTAERVKRVARGYTNAKGDTVPGLGGGFQFCKLGKPLFDARGHISPEVRFAELARFVWFIETGMGLPASRASNKAADTASPLLGVHDGRAVYLLYNGILKDRSIDGGNVLTTPLLDLLPAHHGPRVVYGARCAIGADRLRALGITFKQLPYHLRIAP